MVEEKVLPENLPPAHPGRAYSNKLHNLSTKQVNGKTIILMDGTRIVIPRPARKAIMDELHRAHSGLTKTYKIATQLFYWPGMKNDIKNKIDSCEACQEQRPSLTRPKLEENAPSKATTPMKHVATDLFDAMGKMWLTLVDRYSGYGWVTLCNSTCLLYTSPSPRDLSTSRMPSSA